MPEFVMEGLDHAARAEAPFVLGFIEAMFFTCSDDLPEDVGYTDIHPDSLQAIRRYCVEWQCKAADPLTEAYTLDYDEAQAGCDLWFTMNGHGVGFWDRGLGDVGDKLSDLARYHEVNPFFGDHMTYGNAPFVHLDI